MEQSPQVPTPNAPLTATNKSKSGTFAMSTDELNLQIQNYNTLPVWKSYRKEAALVIFLSVLFTVALIVFTKSPVTIAIIIALLVYIILGVFVFQGKKWAIITTGIIYTIDKLFTLIFLGIAGIVGIIWLLAFASLGYKAYKVEQERAKLQQRT